MKVMPLFVFPGVTNTSEFVYHGLVKRDVAVVLTTGFIQDLSDLVGEYEYPYNDCGCRCNTPSPDFPKNFVEAYLDKAARCADNIMTAYYIIPARRDIIEAFNKAEIDFVLAFPRMTCKDEYMARYINSSNLCDCKFIGEMTKMWGKYITDCYDCRKLEHCVQDIILEPGQSLKDVLEKLDLIVRGGQTTFDNISKLPYYPYHYKHTQSPTLEGNLE